MRGPTVLTVIPRKAPWTQRDNLIEVAWLPKFLDARARHARSHLGPIHVRQYLDWRVQQQRKNPRQRKDSQPMKSTGDGMARANRERALLSHMWNRARERGYTDGVNPCYGVEGHAEPGRENVYIEDDDYHAVWEAADQPTRDAMDLAYLTGQRPADTLKFGERDVRGGVLQIAQDKTGIKLRMVVEGDLAQLLERIATRKRGYVVRSTALIVNEEGQRLTASALRARFDTARDRAGVDKAKFQFSDLRAKAGTDKTDAAGDIRQAQKQLEHASVTMTEHYVRARRGDLVKPTK